MATRTRLVYNSDKIAHLWAHRTQDEARNAGKTFFFEGRVIYSWRTSYPIGHIVDSPCKGSKDRLVLIQENTYSSSTSRHISRVRQAVSHMESVTVPHMLTGWKGDDAKWHVENVAWLKSRIETSTGKAMRARTNVEWHLGQIEHYVAQGNLYAKFFKLRDKFENSLTVENMAEMRAKAKLADKLKHERTRIADEKKRIEQERLDALERPKAQERLDAWRNGGPRPNYGDARVLGLKREETGDLLRVVGDMVETSQGAEFPVSHARLGLALVRRTVASGAEWRTNGHTLRLGPFKIDWIEVDGTVHAGCHVVRLTEIKRIADQLEGSK